MFAYFCPKEEQKKITNAEKIHIVRKYRQTKEKWMLNSASQITNLLLLKK